MLSRQRLLIIEDVSLIALDIQRVLEDANAEQAVFARDFGDARKHAERFADFDLAIVNPPGRDASEIETAALLASAGPAIVVCSATMTDFAGTPLAGAEVITKPFADGDLLAACHRALSRRAG